MSYAMDRVHTDPRLRRRRKAVSRSRRRKFFVRVVVLLSLAILVWAALWSPLLDVRDLQLRGAKHTSAREVIEALDIGSGTNILRLSTDEIQAQVEDLPWVKHVSVSRVLPDTLRIKIKEREAAMVLSMGAADWIVDESGRVLAAGRDAGLPVLAVTDVEGIEIGMDLEADQLVGALSVYRSLSNGVQRKIAAILAPTPERITLVLADGSQVRYGSAELLAAKSNVLTSLLRRLARDGTTATYIDLRVPTSPAVAPVVVAPVVPEVAVPSETEVEATSPGSEVDPEAEVAPDDPSSETEIQDGTAPAAEDAEEPADDGAAD